MIPFPADDEAPAAPRFTRCRACRKPLKARKWQELGFGRCCARRLGLLPAAGPRLVRLARVRAGGDVEGQADLLAEEEGEE
ncbi:hypothetical protein [Streptosporangium sp. CA-115845]|uniref:hypothetical protein n=1 Tax=Streptosporangium sp. CA-115845 TaxID=3240071 RepID=UPI003D8A6433